MNPTLDRPAPAPSAEPDEEDRLVAAVEEYMAALDAGGQPSRQELLARYPDLSGPLAACLDALAFVESVASGMDEVTAPRHHGAPDIEEGGPGRLIGDFRLEREIGRGGMGVVYRAFQLSLGRPVAVKVLPRAATFDPRHLRRFLNEARAAAQLHHTNIVPVYAVGCERGVHFYAMQLIEGRTLNDVIRTLRELRRAGIRPTGDRSSPVAPPSLSRDTGTAAELLTSLHGSKRPQFFRTVAELGLQAAEALEYAHQLGVVHRDIKPGNLMLDARGNLWVTDFGLAQFHGDGGDGEGLTVTGDVVGTLRYMSPEQALARPVGVDHRTDLYSLGATLYELLTLERAVPGDTRGQLLHRIDTLDPRPPRSLDRTIPAELKTIIAKAVAKDPADRYGSAGALAEDLRRFLRDEPILARPPSAWDKAIKWTRRHRTLTLSAVAMLLLTTAGLLASTVLIAREQSRTREALLGERERAREADRNFRQARDAVDLFTRVASEDMDQPQLRDLRIELLEASLSYYQRFIEQHKDDPATGAALAESRARVSSILLDLTVFQRFFTVTVRSELLPVPAVRKELGLTAASSEDGTEEFVPGRWSRFLRPGEDLSRAGPEAKQSILARVAGEIEAEVGRALDERQAERLRQIARQLSGPAAFFDAEVVAALGLGPEQEQRIRAALKRHRVPRFIAPGRGLAGEADGRRHGQAMREVLDLLTAEQRERWGGLTGKPFTAELSGAGGTRAGPWQRSRGRGAR